MSKTAWWVLWWVLSITVLVASVMAYPYVADTLAAGVLTVTAAVAFTAQAVSACVVFARVVTWPLRHARRSA